MESDSLGANFSEDHFLETLIADKSVEKAVELSKISPGDFIDYCRSHEAFFNNVRAQIHGMSSIRALDRYATGTEDHFFKFDKLVGNTSFVRELLRGLK